MLDKFFKFKQLNVPDESGAPQTKKVLPWIWFFSKPHKWELSLYVLMQLFRNVFFMSMTVFITKIAEIYETGKIEENPNAPYEILTLFVVLSMLCYALWVLIIRRTAINDKTSREMSMYAIRHYMNMSLSWHELSGSGGKMQRVTNARHGLFELFQSFFWDITGFVGIFITVIISVSVMNMPSYFILLIYGFIISYLTLSSISGNWLLKPTNKYFEALEILNSKVYEFVNSIASVKVFNLQNHLMKTGSEKELVCHQDHVNVIKVRGVRWALTDILTTFWILGVALISLYEVNRGMMTISAFVMVILFMISIWEKLSVFTRMYGQLVEYYTAVKRLVYNLATKPVVLDREDAKPLLVEQGRVKFENVAFKYNDLKTVLKDFDLDIGAQEKIGLIGSSGAGKTTLVKLLARFYDVTSGGLYIDGQNVEDITMESLRDNLAIIPQDIALFNHSVLDNIRYGRMNASDEDVIGAAKKAHAHEFIKELPEGYETLVGERGVKLSGGQRQRIAIARAILKDAPILILDEATSALDSESERLIQESLKELMEGKTVIAIAHRLSTINHLDRLIVMDQGQIVEDGQHDELLTKEGLYAKLWSMQSGGFLGD